MADFFLDYQLLAESGLFDADYYVATYPDVAAARMDPLSHYIERGAVELRNPSADFDARDYVDACRRRGEIVDNPLLHYIKAGAGIAVGRHGRSTMRVRGAADDALGGTSKVQCFCDLVEITVSGLISVTGWSVAASAIERILVLLDGIQLGEAVVGLERPDVAARFPGLPHARHAGFSFAHRSSGVSGGPHVVTLRHFAGGDSTEIVLAVTATTDRDRDTSAGDSARSNGGNIMLSIDRPQVVEGAAVNPVRGNLEIAGWALARKGVDAIEVTIDGTRVKSISAGIRRLDVQRAFPDWEGALTAGFSTLLPHRALPTGSHNVAVAVRDHTGQVARSEFRITVEEVPDIEGPWALRRRVTPAEVDLMARPLHDGNHRPLIDVIVPLPKGRQALMDVRTTLASLASQVYGRWRLHVLSSGEAPKSLRRALLDGFDSVSDRVILVSGPSAATRILTAASDGTHLMVLKAGDELGSDAMMEFALMSISHPDADLLYCDERRRNPASGRIDAFFKPQWSPDLLLSMNYLGRSWCVRRDVVSRARIEAKELISGGHYHLALRLTEHARSICHVPATLVQAAGEFAEDGRTERRALHQALRRRGIAGSVEAGRTQATYRVRREIIAHGLVSIIIPTKAARGLVRVCIETLRKHTAYRDFEIVCVDNISSEEPDWKRWLQEHADKVIEVAEPFNWSLFNNRAVKASRGEFLVFLNDDIEVTDPNWLSVLLEHAQRPEVGVVGPQLLYPDGSVQHAGMFLAGSGMARHAFRSAGANDPGYFGLALAERNVIAVTGACMMMRRETFDLLGGFDEAHAVVNNDLDFCLRVLKNGLRTLYTPHTSLIHHELASRSEIQDTYDARAFGSKWQNVITAGDPFFHRRLSKDRDDYAIDWEAIDVRCAGNPVFRPAAIRRILVVKLDHIGDCIIALPAIRRLKRHFPDARISVLTGSAAKSIWAMEPVIDSVIEFDFFHARSSRGLAERSEADWQALRKELAAQYFDLAIDLRRHWETRPVLQYTGASYLAGFDMQGRFPWLDVAIESFEDSALLRKRQHAADDLINLVDAVAAAAETDRAGFSQMPSKLSESALARLTGIRKLLRKRVVCVHPAAGNELRQWPTEYFQVLIDQLIETEDVHVILIGGPDEKDLAESIIETIVNKESVWSMVGKIRLQQLPSLISCCALFVGNNSGPQHLAAGLGLPTVGIHSGVVDVREWGARGVNAVAIQRSMTCSPCYNSTREGCQRDLACLRGLLPEHVVSLCRRMLSISRMP